MHSINVKKQYNKVFNKSSDKNKRKNFFFCYISFYKNVFNKLYAQ